MTGYTFDLSKTHDIGAIVLGGITFSLAFLAGVPVKEALSAAIGAGSGVIGYTGITPKAA